MKIPWLGKNLSMPKPEQAPQGRAQRMPVPEHHHVNGNRLEPPFPDGLERAVFGMGCFWGAERKFWEAPGVYTTAVGYAGGVTPNPTYQEVCGGYTGHTEVVLVVFDPRVTSYAEMLRIFWESHDPTQGMRQGNDVGTQYRSAIYTYGPEQAKAAAASRKRRVTPTRPPFATPATAPSRARSGAPPTSTTPRRTTSSISPRIRTATAGSGAPG